MDNSTPTVSPLRQRMLDDMPMRKMVEHTQDGYIRAVRKLAAFLGRSPDTATIEELRRFQLHLVDAGTGPVTTVAISNSRLIDMNERGVTFKWKEYWDKEARVANCGGIDLCR